MKECLNNEGEYGKYILQELVLPAVHATPDAIAKSEKAGRKRILWMDGSVLPAPFQINTAWYYSANHEYMDKWAVEEGEYKFGLCSCSAPVRDSSGAVRYAVGIVGMFDNARSPDFARDIELTRGAAAQISTALGYREQLHP